MIVFVVPLNNAVTVGDHASSATLVALVTNPGLLRPVAVAAFIEAMLTNLNHCVSGPRLYKGWF